MSNLFLKNNYDLTESSINVANILGINNNKTNYHTGGAVSPTSTANLSKINSTDINNLLSMLTSESANNSDNTEHLENRLTNMLNQNGIKILKTRKLHFLKQD